MHWIKSWDEGGIAGEEDRHGHGLGFLMVEPPLLRAHNVDLASPPASVKAENVGGLAYMLRHEHLSTDELKKSAVFHKQIRKIQ